MKIALTGATGLVGRFLARGLAAAGHEIDPLPGWRLGRPAALDGAEAGDEVEGPGGRLLTVLAVENGG